MSDQDRAMINRSDQWFCGFCEQPVEKWTRATSPAGAEILRIEPCGHTWVQPTPYWQPETR